MIWFADRRWSVKWADHPVGPGPNRFDDSRESIDVDHSGGLVLRVRRRGEAWVCAEVVGEDETGYGTYEWTVRSDVSGLDRHVVLGMFTWSDDAEQSNRELDIEVSAWGRRGPPAGQFVVQPSAPPGHQGAFRVPRTGSWPCSFDWSPGRVTFRAGSDQTWIFAGAGVPTPGGVRPRVNLWLYRGVAPRHAAPITVTIAGFRFTPHQ